MRGQKRREQCLRKGNKKGRVRQMKRKTKAREMNKKEGHEITRE